MKWFYIVVIIVFTFSSCSNSQSIANAGSFTKIEMHLSAFGVESDNFPSIDVNIDFVNNSNTCRKWFYNPAFKDSVYSFSKNVIDSILQILKKTDWEKIKTGYATKVADLPNSILIIFTRNHKLIIEDYGLHGDKPLQELYALVYK